MVIQLLIKTKAKNEKCIIYSQCDDGNDPNANKFTDFDDSHNTGV